MKSITAPIATEDQECIAFVTWLELQKKAHKVTLFTHVANENNMRLGIRVAMQKKRLGVRKGFPDYIVLTPTSIYFVEMKRTKGSVVSPEQQAWIDALNRVGLAAKVCKGWQEAVSFIEQDDFEGE